MSIADKRTCSVVKESLDHADVETHLQAHVKYAGRKIKDQENRRAHISTLPTSNEDIESDYVRANSWHEAAQSWTKGSVESENTKSKFPLRHRNPLSKPSKSWNPERRHAGPRPIALGVIRLLYIRLEGRMPRRDSSSLHDRSGM
jgi:hypothetical protein